MRPPLQHLIATALVLVVCHAAFNQAAAKVVRDNKGKPANPAIEAGGHHLLTASSAQFPYSLIGATANDERWIGACNIWPWKSLDAFALHRHTPHSRMTPRPFDDPPFNRFTPLVK
jgi:hypothetical protein